MTLALLDPYRPADSRVHSTDARVKLALVLAFIVSVNVTPVRAWLVHAGYLIVALIVARASRVSPLAALGRSTLALPFVLMAAGGLPFVREGTPVAAVDVAGLRVAVTDVGLRRFSGVLIRSWLSLLASILLVFTTHFTDVVRAMRALGLPVILASIVSFMYRYMYVLVGEAGRLMRAREARSADPESGSGGRNLWWRARVTGSMVGTLFLRTYERSERIYQAMLARGFDGEMRALSERALYGSEVAWTVAACFALALSVAVGYLVW